MLAEKIAGRLRDVWLVIHRSTLLPILLGGGVFLFLFWLVTGMHLLNRILPITSQDTITVQPNGTAIQNGRPVGHFLQNVNDTATLSLLATNPAATSSQEINLSLALPTPVKSQELTTRITSIQGVDGMEAYQVDPTTVALFLQNVLPDSHTVVSITVPAAALRLSPAILLFSWVTNLPDVVWLLVCALILLGALLFSAATSRPTRPMAAGITEHRPPEGLTPVETAILLRGTLQANDISALLYDLANRGFLEIIMNEHETLFLRPARTTTLAPHEGMLLNLVSPAGHQPASLSSIISNMTHDLFSTLVSSIYVEAYRTLSQHGLFVHNPRYLHLRYKTLGIATQFLSLTIIILSYFWLRDTLPGMILLGLTLYLIGFLIYRVGYRLVPLTEAGRQEVARVLDFISYLSDSHPIGDEGVQGVLFYRYLPYALVTGTEQSWIQRFRDVPFYVPPWFFSSREEFLDPIAFIQGVRELTDLIGSIFVRVKDPNVD